MIDFESRYFVSDQQWQEYCENTLDQYISDPGDGTIPENERANLNAATLALFEFLETGDVNAYIDSANENSHAIGWSTIFGSNPSRSYDGFIGNIKLFWTWVLEAPSKRIEYPHLYEDPKLDNYFWKLIYDLHSGAGLADGVITNRLFREVFGEEFQADICFPYKLGADGWNPKTTIHPEDFFFRIMVALEYHLFEKPSHFERSIVVGTIDYWLSIVPHLGDDFFSKSGYFSLEYDLERYLVDRMSSDEEIVFRNQGWLRSFFGQLHGFNLADDKDSYIKNDPELIDYIRGRFAQFDLPLEYHEFIAFLYRHKDDAMNASEGIVKEEVVFKAVEVEESEPLEGSEELIETELTHAIHTYCSKHAFDVDPDKVLNVQPGAPWEIEEELYSVFEEFGATAATESGLEPVEFLPSYVLAGLKQVGCQGWKVLTCTSDDSWMNATVSLESEDGSQTYEMYIERVNNSDWVPEGLEWALQAFSKEHASKSLKFLYSDAAFLMLPLTESQISELDEIMNGSYRTE